MYDHTRSPFNVADEVLWANTSNTEAEIGADQDIDIVSNGFVLKANDARTNSGNEPYIFMALAEEPLVSSNGVPATAR